MLNDLLAGRGNFRLLKIGFRRVFFKHRSDSVDFGFSPKSPAAGKQFVENCAHAEDVAAMIHSLGSQLLGRHIRDRTDQGAAAGDSGKFFHRASGFRRLRL